MTTSQLFSKQFKMYLMIPKATQQDSKLSELSFWTIGSILDQRKANSGRKKTVLNDELIERVDKSVTEDGHKSIRERVAELTVSIGTMQKTLKHLKLRAYKPVEGQLLRPESIGKRIAFCQWMLNCRINLTVLPRIESHGLIL